MKQIFFSIAILSLVLVSCSKKESADPVLNSIEGAWRMVIVKDNVSGLAITKPSSVQGNVDIIFTPASLTNGIFSGHTPTNDIQQNDYSTGSDRTISIPNLSMTKVAETTWGNEFVAHIRNSREYYFETDGNLSIKTISKTLTFKRL
jgi:hypothetical protein